MTTNPTTPAPGTAANQGNAFAPVAALFWRRWNGFRLPARQGIATEPAAGQVPQGAADPIRPHAAAPGSLSFLAADAAVRAVLAERRRQDSLYSEQDHDAGTWALILLEEVGEWARAELERRFGTPTPGAAKTEAAHAAAVALAIVEHYNRQELKGGAE